MNKQIKRFCVTMIMVLVIYCICNSTAYAFVWGNWRECANTPACSSTVQTEYFLLKTCIEESAGNFLNSHSNFQAFLNRVELAESNGLDRSELKEILYIVIENMEKAKAAYTNFKTASEKIPYNQAMIDQLKIFDYDGFRVQYGAIEPIFAKVKNYLRKGNIRGFDAAVLTNMDIILKKLYMIKGAVNKDQMPEISLLWRANQAYIEAQLFGQYMSEVFKDILEGK